MKCTTLVAIAALLTLLPAVSYSETHIPAGPISGTWNLAGSPYYIEGNVIISVVNFLTIEPGVQVYFLPSCRFRIEGQLLAIGTPADSILFTASDTTQGSESLDFLNTNLSPMDSSRLEYCIISYGLASPSPDMYMHGGGIYIKNSSRLVVSHCLITRCKTRDVVGAAGVTPGGAGGSAQSGHGGAIYCELSSPIITANTFSFNRTGDALGGAGGDGYDDWPYYGNAYGGLGGEGGMGSAGNGGAIYFTNTSSANLFSNEFHDNRTGIGFGGMGGRGGSAIAEEGSAYGGDGGTGGQGSGGYGGSIYCNSSPVSITNNLIYGNSLGDAYGGTGGSGGQGWGAYGTIWGDQGNGGNGFGGKGYAFYWTNDYSSNMQYNTILGQGPISVGHGGLPNGIGYNGTHLIFCANAQISNSILWGNVTQELNPEAQVSYSCIEGGHAGTGNINLNPLFVSPQTNTFYLMQLITGHPQQSPCVDTGDPVSLIMTGTTRTDGVQDSGIVDMGYHYPLIDVQSVHRCIPLRLDQFTLMNAYPNPFNPLTTISFGLPETAQVKLTIFDVMGREVATLVDGQRDAGIHNVTFDATGLASGIYLYKFEASGSGSTPTTFIQKMVLLK